MNQSHHSNVGVVDILYAVAIGEGFFAAMYDLRSPLLADGVTSVDLTALARSALAFLLIIMSWVRYRSHQFTIARYPTSEFITDIMIMLCYMSLFVIAPFEPVFYMMFAFIHILWLVSWLSSRSSSFAYPSFIASFAVGYALLSVWATFDTTAEICRLSLAIVFLFCFRFMRVRWFPPEEKEGVAQ
jgi:hypothetical protein